MGDEAGSGGAARKTQRRQAIHSRWLRPLLAAFLPPNAARRMNLVAASSSVSAPRVIKGKQPGTCLFLRITLSPFSLLVCLFVFFPRKGATRWQRWRPPAPLARRQNPSISPATRVTLLDLSPTNLSADALCGRKTSGHSLSGAPSHCQNAHWRFKNGGRGNGEGGGRGGGGSESHFAVR